MLIENLKKISSNNIKILTNIDNNELPYFYKLSDIFVMVSKHSKDDIEGFGIVYLEAGLFKKPVIGNIQGGSREAILKDQTGLLIHDDKEELKQAIIKLIQDPELAQRLGQQAYQRIEDNFQWKDIAHKLKQYLNE